MRPDTPRFSAVPWLDTDSDLRPFGEPETSIDNFAAQERIIGLYIAWPFGRDTDALLSIRANLGSGEVTLAISTLVIPEQAEAPIEPAQSNPRRHDDDGGD